MSPRLWIPLVAAGSLTAGCTAAVMPPPQESPPALVVMISVDQLRADLVTRYDQFYSDGLRYVIDRGAYFDAVHDHGISETAPGHAAIATGTIPARSGIVANEWMERRGDDWETVYTVEDPTTPIVGLPDLDGMSPRNLLRSGVADWVTEADARARVVSIAGKDRSAVIMGGRVKGTVYWYDPETERFITSTYYTQQDPAWVTRFNSDVMPILLDSVWEATAAPGAKALARPDTAAFEGDGTNSFFPHRYAGESRGGEVTFATWVSRTPAPDRAVMELTRIAVRETELGRRGVTDFLAVGFSQLDRVGHRYGPLSREQLENLLHLDRVLGDLFRLLDEQVGEGRWVAAFSADHGVLTMPEWRVAQGEPGKRLTGNDRRQMAAVRTAARESAPAGETVQAQARALSALPFVAGAYTREEIAAGVPRDSIVRLLRNSYHPDRMKSDLARNEITVIGMEGTYMSTEATGTGHGTPYYYDRSVPLVLLGASVRPGRRDDLVRTVDLAPTLALLAGITAPGDLDGRELSVGPDRN